MTELFEMYKLYPFDERMGVEKFRAIRSDLGLTQTAMSHLLGKQIRVLQQWEAGTVRVPKSASIMMEIYHAEIHKEEAQQEADFQRFLEWRDAEAEAEGSGVIVTDNRRFERPTGFVQESDRPGWLRNFMDDHDGDDHGTSTLLESVASWLDISASRLSKYCEEGGKVPIRMIYALLAFADGVRVSATGDGSTLKIWMEKRELSDQGLAEILDVDCTAVRAWCAIDDCNDFPHSVLVCCKWIDSTGTL